MDLTKVADEVSNTTKFFGDWHLRGSTWASPPASISRSGKAWSARNCRLDGLYTMLQQDSMNRAMLLLEITIVALFVIDLVIIVVLGIK